MNLRSFKRYNFREVKFLMILTKFKKGKENLSSSVYVLHKTSLRKYKADLATERDCQLTTVRADQTTGLTNGRAANCAPEVVFSPFRALSRRQLTFPSCC